MNFENFDYNHIKLAMEYLERECKGSVLTIGVNLENRLEIRSKTAKEEHITILIHSSSSNYLPTILKEDRLQYVVERLKKGLVSE